LHCGDQLLCHSERGGANATPSRGIPCNTNRFPFLHTGCATILRVLPLAAIFLLLAPTLLAQDCLTRKLPINISNKDWQRVSGIPAENIQGTYRGKPISVLALKTDYSPKRRVLLLLDTSGSMSSGRDSRGRTYNASMPLVVNKTIALLPPETPLAVGHFGSKVELWSYRDSERARAIEAVKDILAKQSKFEGRTPLFAALHAGVSLFGPIQPGDSIILFTDASENASKNVDQFAKEFERSGLRLFAFVYGLNDEDRSTPEEIEGPRQLLDLIERTGGFMISVPRTFAANAKEADEAVTLVASALVSRVLYSQELTIQLPETGTKAEKLKLRFSGLDPKQAKQLRLEYPAVIQPCEASTSAAAAQP
jgi:hypothetical protein